MISILVDKLTREKFIRNDRQFQELYKKYFNVVFHHVNFLVGGDVPAAEDITQETLIKLYSSPPSAADHLSAWLLKVSSNLAYNYIKSNKQRTRRENKAFFRNLEPAGSFPPEEIYIENQEVAAVKEILNLLEERDRICLLLKFSGFSYTEISEITGVNKNSVGQVLARAQVKFKKEYLLRQGGT